MCSGPLVTSLAVTDASLSARAEKTLRSCHINVSLANLTYCCTAQHRTQVPPRTTVARNTRRIAVSKNTDPPGAPVAFRRRVRLSCPLEDQEWERGKGVKKRFWGRRHLFLFINGSTQLGTAVLQRPKEYSSQFNFFLSPVDAGHRTRDPVMYVVCAMPGVVYNATSLAGCLNLLRFLPLSSSIICCCRTDLYAAG